MHNNIEFSVYGGFNDEVSGVEEYPPTSLLDENVYYSVPLDPAYSGSYVSYLNGDFNVDNSGYYQESSYQCYYPLTNYVYYPDNVYYPYHVYVPVYCYYFAPNYDYYLPRSEYVVSGSNYENYPDNAYYPYHVYVPVYCYYFVPTYDYYLPRSEYVVSGSNGFEQDPFDQRSLLPTSVEPNLFTYEECYSTLYNNEYRSFSDGSVEELVDDGITSFHISYTEYPENLVEAGNEDEDENSSCDKKLVENVVPNRADVNVFTVLYEPDEQPGGVYMNICDDDVEDNIIKKVSLMSIDDVQKDIDETYEYGKADLYNEVLKGYTGIKCILEELEWECHSLDDIQEEEEPEDDSDEMDFDENVLKKNNNLQEDLDKNKFLDVEDSSHFASDSLSEESPLALSQEALIDNCEIMVEENPLSKDSSVTEENDKSDPVLEHSLCEEKKYSESVSAIEEDYPPVNPPVSEDEHEMISVPDVCFSRDEIHCVSGTEEVCPYTDSPVIEENHKMNSVQDLCLSKEKIDSVSRVNNEEPHVNVASEDGGDEAPDTLEPAASEKKQRKKRFSSLRKFFGRICCCVKKPS